MASLSDIPARDILETSRTPLLVLDDALIVAAANAAFFAAFALSPDHVIGTSVYALGPGWSRAAWHELLDTMLPRARVIDRAQVLHEAPGGPRQLLVSARAVHAAGSAERMVLLGIELVSHELERATHSLHDERLPASGFHVGEVPLAEAGVGMWEMEVETGAWYWAESMELVSGVPRQRFPGTTAEFLALVHEADRARVQDALNRAIREGSLVNLELRLGPSPGGARWQCMNATAHSRNGGVTFVGVSMDTSERKSLEEQFLQSQKMEAIGRLAGGVAHDFNNLLTVIQGYSDLALQTLGSDHEVAGDLAQVEAAAQSAAGLTRQLLAFSRRQVLQPQPLDLNVLVERIQLLLRRVIGEDIDLRTRLEPELPLIEADPHQIEQVIMNLSVNARDAMPGGGQLTINTAVVQLDEVFVSSHRGARPGAHVMLSVSDSGVGMDEGTRKRLFEPFFTTKEFGKGTGLGLATVYGIVKQSGGSIWVYSEPNVGTTFKVYLPIAAGHQRQEAAPAPAISQLGGIETILLAEDEDGVRSFAAEVLRRYGYTVLEAADAVEAERISTAHAGVIHLLLTDVVMARGSGRQLAQVLRRARPALRVVYMSGYTDDAIVQHGVLQPGIAFLEKPFTPRALLTKLREAIESPTDPAV